MWDRYTQPPELVVESVWGRERYAIYLLYWYNSTNTDAKDAARLVYTAVSSMPSSHVTLFGRSPNCTDVAAQRRLLRVSGRNLLSLLVQKYEY